MRRADEDSGYNATSTASVIFDGCYSTIPVGNSTRVDFYYLPFDTIADDSGSASITYSSETPNGFTDVTNGGKVSGDNIII
jgi:hypothetical protein